MEQKTLSNWLKGIIIGVGICGLIIYGVIVPMFGFSIAETYDEFSYMLYPWLVFIWISALPCYAVLFCGLKIAVNIGKDNAFCMKNASLFKWISGLALGDTVYFFIGHLVLMMLNMSHPSIVLLSLFVEFFGIAIAIVAAVMSHLVKKAALLQDENDLTI
ncbi:MAG: DUF2975 domain-containing protein [Clostridia bacterium]|nr:DUF2975 domain-containing protein [Clostridia bacterium]